MYIVHSHTWNTYVYIYRHVRVCWQIVPHFSLGLMIVVCFSFFLRSVRCSHICRFGPFSISNTQILSSTLTTISIPYWAFSINSVVNVCVPILVLLHLNTVQFIRCVVLCWVDLCIFSFFWYYNTRIFLILLEFNMFVIADVWKFGRVCVRACVHVCEYFWSFGSVIPMVFGRKWVEQTMYCKHCALESMENLSCKVKPTQFVYRIP